MVAAKSVRAAAINLGTTHATVSRRIRALEEDLGGMLFERRQEGFELTAFGQSLVDLTEEIAASVHAIDRTAFGQESSVAGLVRLSAMEELYAKLLAAPIAEFLTQHPSIELNVETTAGLKNLNRREADIIVRITREPPENAVGRMVAQSPLAIYATPGYLDNRPGVDRWIALDYAPALKPVLGARTAFVGSTVSVVAQMLRQGQGIGYLPCFEGENDPALVRVPEFELLPDMEIWVLTHADLRDNPRVRVLLDLLYRTFAQHRSWIEGHASTTPDKGSNP